MMCAPAEPRPLAQHASHHPATLGPVSLYVHVPFCVLKCAYCDFHSQPFCDVSPEEPEHFAWAVGEAARHWAALGVLDDVLSLYVGGGTPTTLGDGLTGSIADLCAIANMRPGAEITVETNPDTSSPELAARLHASGVTRFSVGVQSFDGADLRVLGRCHDAQAAERAVRELVATGARVALDLMCGVPGQSLASWQATLERAVATGAGHVSVYPLTVEEATPLAHHVATGALPEPDPDAAAEMMERADEVLADAGLARYEIASYAREGEQCVHNLGYWTGRPYIGLGPSASSMVPVAAFRAAAASESWADPSVVGVGRVIVDVPADAARVRFTHAADTVAFIRTATGAPEEVEYLTAEEALREDVVLGLRLAEGVAADLAERAGVVDALLRLEQQALVERAGGRWRLTRRGWLLGNEVFAEVW